MVVDAVTIIVNILKAQSATVQVGSALKPGVLVFAFPVPTDIKMISLFLYSSCRDTSLIATLA